MTAAAIDAYAQALAEKLLPYIRRQMANDLRDLGASELSKDAIKTLAWEGIIDLLYDCNRADIPSHAELRLARWLALKVLVHYLTLLRRQALAEEAESATGTVQSVTALSTKVDYAAPEADTGAALNDEGSADEDDHSEDVVDVAQAGRYAAVASSGPSVPPVQPDMSREDALVKRIFAGQTNPYTGRPVESVQDYMDYENRAREEALEEAGISKEQFDEMIRNTPVMQEARALVQRQEAREAQAIHDQAMAEVDRGVQAIREMNPSIKSLADIAEMDTFPTFDRLVRQGYALDDAYKLANMDAIINDRVGQAEQRVRNNQSSKSHLRSHQGQADGDGIVVPKEVAAAYRQMIPGITDEEIIKDYAKNNGGVS